jgi:hypothetical protein
MDARVREKQVERSWLQHDPTRGKIPPEAWRALRQFKRQLVPQVQRINKAGADRDIVAKLLRDYSLKAKLGKQRAFAKLIRHFHPAKVEKLHNGILWSFLDPRGALLTDPADPGEEQDAIISRYGLSWVSKKRQLVGYLAFSIEAPDHALAKMLQRAVGTDIRQALHEAHHALFQADAGLICKHVDDHSTFYLPCGPGLLICEGIRADTQSGHRFVFARARTWISTQMAHASQVPIPAGIPNQLTVMSAIALRQSEAT